MSIELCDMDDDAVIFHFDDDLRPSFSDGVRDERSRNCSIINPSTPRGPSGVNDLSPKKENSNSGDESTTLKSEWKELITVSGLSGLSSAKVEEQRLKYGWNESEEKKPSLFRMILSKFTGFTSVCIEIAMILSFVLGHTTDGVVIVILLLLNGAIAFNEEYKARKALNDLKQKLQLRSRVQRNGLWEELNAKELVPGDRIRIRAGDVVGADIVLTSGEIDCDQSSLTGESAIKHFSVTEKRLVYAGSVLKRGEATGVVVAIGSSTFFGITSQLVQQSKPSEHIQNILKKVVVTLMSIVICLVIATLIVLGVKKDKLVDAVPLLLMVLVTALPVALPAMFSVSLALGSQELSKRSVLVTRLNVIEDAAMMSLLFSDKTGTLTKNELQIHEILPINDPQKNQKPSDREEGKNVREYTVNDVLLAALLASKEANADPIDMAIIKEYRARFAEDVPPPSINSLFPSFRNSDYQTINFIPFDASNRRTEATVKYLLPLLDMKNRPASAGSEADQHFVRNAATVTDPHTPFARVEGADYRVMKGAVPTLSALSSIAKDSSLASIIDLHVAEHSSHGYRTMAVCVQQLTKINHSQNQMSPIDRRSSISSPPIELIGLIALYDPPRTDSASTIESLSSLGIQTKMLTGDAQPVAASIAKQIGLKGKIMNLETEKHAVLQEGGKTIKEGEVSIDIKDHSALSSAAVLEGLLTRIDPLLPEVSGFSQMFPRDKHYLVKAAQKRGVIVGVTGDGVNDAPALKQAEIGAAVHNATDIAKGAASAVLLTDGLMPFVDLVKVGRTIHRRVAVWVINKIAKSTLHSLFILVMFLITGQFPIDAFMAVLLLLLMDFVMIAIATDNQPPALHPEKWNLLQLTRVGLVVGLPGSAEMMCIIFITKHYFNISDQSFLMTLAFECMFLWGMIALFSARERSFFFSSRSSLILTAIVVVEVISVVIVAAVGVSGVFEPLRWKWSLSIFAIALGCFVVNDTIKTTYIRIFEKDL